MLDSITCLAWTISVIASKAAEAFVVSISAFRGISSNSCRVRLGVSRTYLLAGTGANRTVAVRASEVTEIVKVLSSFALDTLLTLKINGGTVGK